MADIFDMADTWNNGATTFAAIKMNVTNTASAADSLLMDLQVGGVSALRVIASDGRLLLGNANFSACPMVYATGANSNTSLVAFARRGNWPGFLAGNDNGLVGGVARSDGILGFASTTTPADGAILASDVRLYRDAADTLAQRRGVNAQAFNIYNTFTDASNYERARMGWTGNAFVIAPQAAGTGTTRVLHISGLPTSNPGPGILWNNAGTPAIGT
jgi:hypothetical protein